ncbi:putative Polycomb group protein ASXL2 [Parasteatoda tepidariorum]|uniref:putative Polycomb group protein ASXL2 n=1 Tax=Parasteatoda tepidariorum TaxID=114398 RepID=UPI0039BC3DD2
MVICVPGKMQFELSKERQARKKKARTWTEAAKLALELYPKTPLGDKEIFNVIRAKGLKDVSGPASLACLNAMLHLHSRGPEAMFYRVDGCTSVFGLASNIPDGGVKMEVDEEESGQEFDPGDSDQDSGASLSPGRKNDRVLYVRLPPGYKSSPLSVNSSCNHQMEETGVHKNDQLPVKPLAYKNEYYTRIRRMNGENMIENTKNEKCNQASAANLSVSSPAKVSQSHSQRAIKHALRQQQKRRRRNTAIAASGNAPPPIPRIIMKPLPPAPTVAGCVPEERWRCSLEKTSLRESTRHKPQTMRELLASIPGLSFKPRKRSSRKLSTAAQIAQTKQGCINIETPDSILVNTNLRALLNKHTFASLPPVYQYRLVHLLPQADRVIGADYSVRLCATALSNEFFARACQEWKKRLQEGEFTPENQMKLKGEAERDHSKLDPWKVRDFELNWGYRSSSDLPEQSKQSFLMNSQLKSSLNPQSKHVPTIKIKPVVRRGRLNRDLSKHRRIMDEDSPTYSDENHPAGDSPLYNQTLDIDTTEAVEADSLYAPPTKKLKLSETLSSNSSESQESSEESIHAVMQETSPCPSPCPSSVTSTTSPCHSVEDGDINKDINKSTSSIIPISLSVTVVQTTAPSQSLVPPITIRSIPVLRPGGSKKSSGRSDGGANLERSYQICKAALEFHNKKEPSSSSSAPPQSSEAVTSSVTTSDTPDKAIDESSLETQSGEIDSQMTESNVYIPETQVTSNYLLKTCTPSTVPTFAINSVSSTINPLDTSNTCTNADVSSLDSESNGEAAECAAVDTSESCCIDPNAPVCMAADSTSIEEPYEFPESPAGDLTIDASPSSVASGMMEGFSEHSSALADDVAMDQESTTSTNIATVDDSPGTKADTTEEESMEHYITSVEPIASQDSVSYNSNCEIVEINTVTTSLLDNDIGCLTSECLDSDSSSLQQPFDDSQVIDEDNTIILSMPSSEEENVVSDDTINAEESMQEDNKGTMDDMECKLSSMDDTEDKHMLEDGESKLSSNNDTQSKNSSFDDDNDSKISFVEDTECKLTSTEEMVSKSCSEMQTSSTDIENDQSLEQENNECEMITEQLTSSEPYTVPQENSLEGELLSKELDSSQMDTPSRPLSAPLNVHASIPEVAIQKRPASSQSYYKRSKVSPIVYFESPEGDDSKSDYDKMPSPHSSDGMLQFSSSTMNESNSSRNDYLILEVASDDTINAEEKSTFVEDGESKLSSMDETDDKHLIVEDGESKLSSLEDTQSKCSSLDDDDSKISSVEDTESKLSSTEEMIMKPYSETSLANNEQSADVENKMVIEQLPTNVVPLKNVSLQEDIVKEDSKKSFPTQLDTPSRPLSVPLHFPPTQTSGSEVNTLKRPASCQSYYRSSKVSPIVYFDSPESDDTKSDCDKIDKIPTPSPHSSDGLLPFSSSSVEESSNSSLRNDHLAVSKAPEFKNHMPSSLTIDQTCVSSKLTPQVTMVEIIATRGSPFGRLTTSTTSSIQSVTSVVSRPQSNPSSDFTVSQQSNKLSSTTDPQTFGPNHLSLPEGCTGGSGGSLPSQAVSVVPASTQLPIASGGVMYPSANGLASVVGTPAGDTPPRSLLQSSPVINGASSGIEGAVTSSGGDSGGGNGSSGNENSCACNLKAMVMCLKCGAFCHDDCIGPSRLCVTCLIR